MKKARLGSEVFHVGDIIEVEMENGIVSFVEFCRFELKDCPGTTEKRENCVAIYYLGGGIHCWFKVEDIENITYDELRRVFKGIGEFPRKIPHKKVFKITRYKEIQYEEKK